MCYVPSPFRGVDNIVVNKENRTLAYSVRMGKFRQKISRISAMLGSENLNQLRKVII